MKALISVAKVEIGDEELNAVDGRELHEFLGVETRFDTWIERKIGKYGFSINSDFCSYLGKTPNGGRPMKMYSVSLDMAKELSMLEDTDRGRQARQYFIQCEKELNKKRKRMSKLDILIETAEEMRRVEHKQQEHDRRITVLEAKSDQNSGATGFYSVKAYCNLHSRPIHLEEAKLMGRKASALARTYGSEIIRVPDQGFGVVNGYHESILDEVFKKESKNDIR